MTRCRRWSAVVVAATLPLAALVGAASGTSIAVTTGVVDLGTLGGADSDATAVNDVGQVAGSSQTADGHVHAFRWTPSGRMRDLGTLAAPYDVDSRAVAINARGDVAGDATDGGAGHAFRWTAGGGMVDLAPAGGYSHVAAMNDAGDVVGWAAGGGSQRAARWTAAGGLQDLGTLGGATSYATAVNASGQVVGNSQIADGHVHAFRWTSSTGMQDLGSLGRDDSTATSINTAGQVVGESMSGSGWQRAFRWTPATGMRDLGTLGGHFAMATAINDGGLVAGTSSLASLRQHAFRWTPTKGMQNLGAFFHGGESPAGTSAVAMNNRGDVTGAAAVGFRFEHAFRWSSQRGLQDLGPLGGGNPRAGGGYTYAAAINANGNVVGSSDTPTGSRHAALWPGTAVVDVSTSGALVYGRSATVTAHITAGAIALPAARLTLYRRLVTPVRVGRWYRLATLTSDARGIVRWRDKPPVTVQYEWRYAGSAVIGPVTSPRVTVHVATRVTARLSATSLHLGHTAVLSGSVSPNHADYPIALQRKTATGWRTVAHGRLNRDSRYAFRIVATHGGAHSYRARMPADPFHGAGTSPTVVLTVR